MAKVQHEDRARIQAIQAHVKSRKPGWVVRVTTREGKSYATYGPRYYRDLQGYAGPFASKLEAWRHIGERSNKMPI